MDWLQFASEMSKAWAWPIAVIVVALLFKGRLENLLGKVRHAKGAGFEFDFSEQVKVVAAEAAAVPAQPRAHMPIEPGSQAEKDTEYFAELLQSTSMDDRPAALVLDSWRNIESLLIEIVKLRKLPVSTLGGRFLAQHALRALSIARLVTRDQEAVIKNLQSLRNRVAHVEFEPTKEAAQTYYAASQQVVRMLIPLLVPREKGEAF